MPEGSIKTLAITRYQEEQLCLAVGQHFRTLTSIKFDTCEVNSRTIQAILTSCPLLEKLAAAESYCGASGRSCHLRLEDAVILPWASNKLTSLGLMIDLGEMSVLDLDWDGLTLAEQNTVSQLDAFYKLLGSLTSLASLDLRISTESDDEDDDWMYRIYGVPAYKKRRFPGLLKLGGDMKSGDRGWLNCLARLGKPVSLKGSFNIALGGPSCVMGQAEVEWIVRHWPKLRVAYFWSKEVVEDEMSELGQDDAGEFDEHDMEEIDEDNEELADEQDMEMGDDEEETDEVYFQWANEYDMEGIDYDDMDEFDDDVTEWLSDDDLDELPRKVPECLIWFKEKLPLLNMSYND
ncbi:hypothetical protein BGW39_000835 [Mortierella sp. 14UC]|nr:hypothetical protein BGW39_000835 [Mortierella sp. 14UC]